MGDSIKKLISTIVVLVAVFVWTPSAQAVQAGGEIPWPLSIQHVVSVKNSVGLWKLSDQKNERLFNVEMARDNRSGFDWVRVAELDPKTYEVLFWGEGFFSPKNGLKTPESSFSNILLGSGKGLKDPYGRYVQMFPSGKVNERPFVLRMVEVETTLGTMLGLTIIKHNKKSFEHLLGSRVMKEPLTCSQEEDEELTCFVDKL